MLIHLQTATLHHVVNDDSQDKQCILATWNPKLIINMRMLIANMAYQEHNINSVNVYGDGGGGSYLEIPPQTIAFSYAFSI